MMKYTDAKRVRKISRPVIWTMICAGLLLVVVSGCSKFTPETVSGAYIPSMQSDDTLVATLVSSLWSTRDKDRTDSEKTIIAFAQKSPAKRELVINKLLSSVNAEKELDGTHTVLNTSFVYWKSVTNIFVELNATEVVDVLIRCVQCSNGMTGNFGEPPASVALVRMGKPILPRLSKGLGQERDAYKRMKLVLCIARIGGLEAISYLEQALRSEPDKDVRNVIKFNLSEMKSNN
jgi:hypothetical protein